MVTLDELRAARDAAKELLLLIAEFRATIYEENSRKAIQQLGSLSGACPLVEQSGRIDCELEDLRELLAAITAGVPGDMLDFIRMAAADDDGELLRVTPRSYDCAHAAAVGEAEAFLRLTDPAESANEDSLATVLAWPYHNDRADIPDYEWLIPSIDREFARAAKRLADAAPAGQPEPTVSSPGPSPADPVARGKNAGDFWMVRGPDGKAMRFEPERHECIGDYACADDRYRLAEGVRFVDRLFRCGGRWLAVTVELSNYPPWPDEVPEPIPMPREYRWISPQEAAEALFNAMQTLPPDLAPLVADRVLTADGPAAGEWEPTLPVGLFRIQLGDPAWDDDASWKLFDPAGADHIGPVLKRDGLNLPYAAEWLFQTDGRHWVLLSRQRSYGWEELEERDRRPTLPARYMTDEEALLWLYEHGYETPERLRPLAEERTLRAVKPDRKRLKKAEKERLVSGYLKSQHHRAAEVTLKEVADALGIPSLGTVQDTDAWQQFQEARKPSGGALASKPIPMTDGILANLADDADDASLRDLLDDVEGNPKRAKRLLENKLRGDDGDRIRDLVEDTLRTSPHGPLARIAGEIDVELLSRNAKPAPSA